MAGTGRTLTLALLGATLPVAPAPEFWNEQPRDAREQAANACRSHFGGE